MNFARPAHVGWAVVLPGTQIGQEPLTLGGEVRDTLTIRPPEPTTGAEANVAAQQLAASGWTEDAQLALLDLVGAKGIPPLTAIDQVEPQRSSAAAADDPNPDKDYFETGCAYDSMDSNQLNARGCYRRAWGNEDEDDFYAGGTSWAYAEYTGDGLMDLTIVTTAHSYTNAKMLEYNPLSTVPASACRTTDIGINLFGVNLSQSQQVCPDKLEPTIYSDGTVYGVDWRGRASSGSRHTELVEVAHGKKGPAYYPAPDPKAMGFAYHMDFKAEPYFTRFCGGGSTTSTSDMCDPAATPKKIVHEILEG